MCGIDSNSSIVALFAVPDSTSFRIFVLSIEKILENPITHNYWECNADLIHDKWDCYSHQKTASCCSIIIVLFVKSLFSLNIIDSTSSTFLRIHSVCFVISSKSLVHTFNRLVLFVTQTWFSFFLQFAFIKFNSFKLLICFVFFFDCFSNRFYSKDRRKPTLVATIPGHMKLGQRRGLTETDCLKINELYQCLDQPFSSRKFYSLCKVLSVWI